jgi:hypothetical protein
MKKNEKKEIVIKIEDKKEIEIVEIEEQQKSKIKK